METIITLGGGESLRILTRMSLAFSNGICTCMITTSGLSLSASATASSPFGVLPTTCMPP
jgi:hypothetical protein